MTPIPIRTSEQTVAVADIIFRQDLYPRLEFVPELVQKYAETLELLPPIEINQNNELIDGWHRWTAYKKAGVERITVTVTETASDMEVLELAIQRNAKHGMQLSQAEKRHMAQRIYRETPPEQQGKKKLSLAKLLSVEERSVYYWVSRIDKDNKERRESTVFNLWLSCYTEEKIAEDTGVTRDVVRGVLGKIESFQISPKPSFLSEIEDDTERWQEIARLNREAATHKSDFKPPIYNVWKQQEKSKGPDHFGNTEARWLDNLLYLYTQPFDVVIDPFAGSGSTIDLCRQRFRRYWVSDRKPIVEREREIRKHDLTEGLPQLTRWQDVSLVYLDPPYWKQAEGEYSTDPQDFGNMPVDEFTKRLVRLITDFAKKLKAGAVIALAMQPTQWNAPDHAYTDHIADLLRAVKLPLDMRYSAPYESQQATAQMVEWAKENRRCLVLTREIVVWRVA